MRAAVRFGFAMAMMCAPALDAAPPTFAHDIAPIVFQYCAPCHRPGEAGPFPLLRYEDAKSHARQIADLTRRRFMPPWLPEAGHGDFVGELRLSEEQIRLFGEWAAAGAPEGVASETPPAPKFTEGWQLGPPDLIVDAAQAFTLPASGPDVYLLELYFFRKRRSHAVCARCRDPPRRQTHCASREPVRGSGALGAAFGNRCGSGIPRNGCADRPADVGAR